MKNIKRKQHDDASIDHGFVESLSGGNALISFLKSVFETQSDIVLLAWVKHKYGKCSHDLDNKNDVLNIEQDISYIMKNYF